MAKVRARQAKIAAEREQLEDELFEARAQVDAVVARLRALRLRCKHPDAVRTSHMGESCLHCYDCGNCP